MNLQYISDSNGKTTGVFIPINEWNELKKKYTGIEDELLDIPPWQVEEVRERFKSAKQSPEKNKDFDSSMDQIDKDL
jgi:hypothetical protein